jgi:hypothetical protein
MLFSMGATEGRSLGASSAARRLRRAFRQALLVVFVSPLVAGAAILAGAPVAVVLVAAPLPPIVAGPPILAGALLGPRVAASHVPIMTSRGAGS